MRTTLGLSSTLLLLAACNGGEELDVDALWTFDEALYGVANLDDDDEDGAPDWEAGAHSTGDDDYTRFSVSGQILSAMDEADALEISLGGDVDQIRVWRDGELSLGGGGETAQTIIPASTDLGGGQELWADVELDIEFAGFLASGDLTVTWLDADGAEVRSETIALRSSPLIINHHLQPAEGVWAMKISGYNDEFIDGLKDGLGDYFNSVQATRYGYDAWLQDELEFGTLTGDQGQRIDVVIDSIRSKNGNYLDDFPEDKLAGADTYIDTWGKGGPTSQDSFGNLEASPPVTVDGVHYPFGRIYWGTMGSSWGLHTDLEEMLEAQTVQAPFQVDISWLCVGHVDEFTSFVPDPSSEKGFKFLITDTALGYELLEGVDRETYLTRFADDHGYDTVGAILDDQALRFLNEELQADYIDPALEIFVAELGLEDSDIVRIPSIFEEYPVCGGATLALIPGTINMLVAQVDDGPPKLFMPDPFLRTDVEDQSADPLIAYTESVLPEGLEFHWIDDWEWYHLGMGEVHCGTNTLRTPIDDWWTSAAHLLED